MIIVGLVCAIMAVVFPFQDNPLGSPVHESAKCVAISLFCFYLAILFRKKIAPFFLKNFYSFA